MKNLTKLIIAIALLAGIVAVPSLSYGQPAFPGCEGYGCDATGWRGGEVIEVTNTNPEGAGSLKAALETDGPRIIVFKVSGTIDVRNLESGRLKLSKPNVYIAGQTAPGDNTWDHCGENDQAIAVGGGSDQPIYNIVLDHTSVSWSGDEMIQFYGNYPQDVTYSWSISSEGLYPCGGRGFLTSNYPEKENPGANSEYAPTRISVHHNLFAHNDGRNPKMVGRGWGGRTEIYDVRNNLAYNYEYEGGCLGGSSNVNYIGNYIIPGANSAGYVKGVYLYEDNGWPTVYVQGNLGPGRPIDTDPEWNITQDVVTEQIADQSHQSLTPFDTPSVTTQSAQEAYDLVLQNAGATLPKRDLVDQRVVNEVRNRTGKLISSQDEVGGWPVMNSVTPPADSDHDGMPDEWETAHGLAPNNYNDCKLDRDGDGYTNIEEYINSLAPIGPELAGDINGDGKVDLADLVELTRAYGTSPGDPDYNPRANFDGDNLIGLADLITLTSNYGMGTQ